MSESLSTILVIGAGTMGAGIAQTAAMAGHKVWLYDQSPEAPSKAILRMRDSLSRSLSKGYVTEKEVKDTLANIIPIQHLGEGHEAGICIEAVKEDLAIKQAVFQEVEALLPEASAIWTNTSMLSISTLAEVLKRPERFCGVHFFNPVPRMKLVEVIAGKQTAKETMHAAAESVRTWGKTPVFAPDAPGFIVNRVLDGIKREALALLDLGVPADQVDTAVKMGLNFPMGPLELMDLIGLDTTLDVLVNQAKMMGRPITQPTKLHELVAEGHLGRKTGRGFYTYPANKA